MVAIRPVFPLECWLGLVFRYPEPKGLFDWFSSLGEAETQDHPTGIWDDLFRGGVRIEFNEINQRLAFWTD